MNNHSTIPWRFYAVTVAIILGLIIWALIKC